MRKWWLATAVAALAWGQNSSPRFEVASVKPNGGGGGPAWKLVLNYPQRLSAENVTLKSLIRVAWDVRDFQIVDAPSWLTVDRFDIEAVSAGITAPAEKKLMLRSLLEERFQLSLHPETRQMPVYELTPAKGGLKLRAPVEGSCIPPDPNRALRPPAPGEQPPLFCGNLRGGAQQIEGSSIQMNSFTVWLSDYLQRTVADRTGFTGTFDVNLRWSDDRTDDDSGLPSIFAALQELGLKLESAKGPVEVLVIDRAEKPTGN